MTQAREPIELSVVIGAHNAARVIETCLLALEQQPDRDAMEVIVSDSSTDGTPDLVRRRFPWVRVLHAREPLSLPRLRGRGIAAARGNVIAILDPYSVADPDWAEQVLKAHDRLDYLVIGGVVDLYRAESASFGAWTLYLNEYALFMSPVVKGPTWILPGSNLSYKRSALFDGETPRFPVFWKTNVNWGIERGGTALWLEPSVRVELNKPIPLADYLGTRYLHGRCFGGMRVEGASTAVRLARALSTVALPVLLLWRWTAGFWPKRRRRLRFAATVPAQLTLFAVWAWGEACGYVRGTGRSCERLHY